MKLWSKAAVAFVLLIVSYLLLGTVAYIPPDWRVAKHVQSSLDEGDLREDYLQAIIPRDLCRMDNFTDALILNQCIHLRSEGWKSILTLPRYDEGIFQCHNLRQAMSGNTEGGYVVHYSRYWHGSTFFTRILLTFMSFMSVRYLLYLLSSALMLWCFVRLWNHVGRALALIIAFALLMVNVFVMQFSVQYVQVLLIALGGMIWLSYHRQPTGGQVALLFLVLGSLTAFLDLLTVPTLTLGLSLVVLVALPGQKNTLWTLLKACLWWAGAYALTWAAKWGIATLLTDIDVFADAGREAAMWQEDGGSYIGKAIAENSEHVRWIYVVAAAVPLIVAACIWHKKGQWGRMVQYLFIVLIPLLFYVVMAHHSSHHSPFTYRGLATSIAAVLMAVATLVDWKRAGQKVKGYVKGRTSHTGD